MRLVLDTNVIASGLLWDGSPRRLLRLSRGEGIRLYTSAPVLGELTDILSRPKFEKKIAASLLSIDQLVEFYAGFADLVRPVVVPRLATDPDDDVVVATAIAARAELLVTGDRALLLLAEYDGGRIVSVNEALQAVG